MVKAKARTPFVLRTQAQLPTPAAGRAAHPERTARSDPSGQAAPTASVGQSRKRRFLQRPPYPMKTPDDTGLPHGLQEAHLRPRWYDRHASPLSVVVLGLLMVLGLTGWLGHAGLESRSAEGPGASFRVEMPAVIRTGDFFEMLVHVHARQDIRRLELEIEPSLWQNITVNGMVPAPDKESGEDGTFNFQFGALKPGQDALIKVSAQINPRLLGRVEGDIRLKDSGQPLATLHRSMKVLF
ncbi:hypothetical protein ACFPPF_12195 [Xenophilus aerolatus]|nr:hypothetical protein [Xenophilus aerolatus]